MKIVTLALVLVLSVNVPATAQVQARYLDRGNDLIAAGDYAGAERIFRDALVTEPHNRVFRAQLALCLVQQRRHAEADRELELVLARYSDDLAASWYLALNRYLDRRYREAAGRFQELLPRLERSAQYPTAHWFIASSLRALLYANSVTEIAKAITEQSGGRQSGLSYAEVDTMLDAYRRYVDLEPQAADRAAIEEFVAWVAKNRPGANASRWVVGNTR